MDTALLKRLLVIFTTILSCLTVFQEAAHSTTDTPVIESISVFAESGGTEQVVFKLNGPHTPKVFRIEGERPRLVFDFYDISYPAGVKKINGVDGKIIAGVRVGMHVQPLKTRVVVDIQKNSPYQYDYSFNVSSNQLVVTFNSDFPAPDGVEALETGGPRHISFEQLKIMHGTAVEKEAEQTIQPPVEPERLMPQSGDADEPAAVIPAESAQEIAEPSQRQAQPAAQADEQPPAPQTAAEPVETQQTAAPPAASQAEETEPVDSVLLDISFEKSINRSETVLFRLNHFSPPLVFGIEKGEPRVVCDFMDTRIDAGVPELIEAGGQFIKRISVSTQVDPQKVRVELILVPNRHYDLQQLFFKEDSLFVVIVKELQKEGS